MKYRLMPNIYTPEDLGNTYLGNPHTAIVLPKRRIDRAEYGRILAETEGGIFTPGGLCSTRQKRRKQYAT